jgi:hypothetical protein
MTNSGMEFEPESAEDGAGDPAAAFEALRVTIETQSAAIGAEMAIIRKGVEAAFDRFDKLASPPDYGADLGRIIQSLGQVVERLAAVEQSPILRQGPDHYARTLKRSGEGLVHSATQQLERHAADLERAGRNLAAHVSSARERKRQDWWLVGVGVVGLVLGILLTLFAPRVLPFSAAPHVASIVMGDTPWRSGMSLMAFDSPAAWNRVVAADQLIEANKNEVAACREAAARTNQDQHCTITVAAPLRQTQ